MSGFKNHKIAFIGFGEAATAFVLGWDAGSGASIAAFDIKSNATDSSVRAAKQDDYSHLKVSGCANHEDALKEADVVFSLVTADQAETAATEAAHFIGKDAYFLDCNSCAPGTKVRNSARINAAGGRYVDVAVMAPVHPKLHQTPVSLSGAYAVEAGEILQSFDMKASIVEGDVGAASSIKMIRSIMIKGMEALFAECVLAGKRAGIDEVVLKSLDKTYPEMDFKNKGAYLLERSMTHGIRRAAEMREVVLTVEELGLNGDMAQATAQWQQRIGDLQLNAVDGESYKQHADKVLNALDGKTTMDEG